MSFATIKTDWFFSIDDEGIYTRGPYWFLQVFVCYGYFLFTTVHAFMAARREPSALVRKQYYTISAFLIAPAIGALLQLLIGLHPFVAPATSISMLIIFLNLQANMINNDSLTGMHNRKSAERYIEELKLHASPRNPFYLYMMDIDKFKKINDSFGHVEGDVALRTIANVLQKVCDEYSGFICRLGGDEFLAVIESKQIKDPEDFPAAIETAMEKEARILNLPYELVISAGYTTCDSPMQRLNNLISDADKDMYKNKQNNKEKDDVER